MKNFLKFSLVGLGCYTIPLIVFYGFHKYSLPFFLVLMGIASYFLLRKESKKNIRKGLVQLSIPLLSLLLITAFLNENVRFVLPYLLFTPVIALCVYYWINSKQKIVFPTMILFFALMSLFSFDVISDTKEVFDTRYLSLFFGK